MIVTESGRPLSKSGLDAAWQRLMGAAIKNGVIDNSERFTLHGLKHRGITDSADKSSGGHRTERMRQHFKQQQATVPC